LQCSFVGDIVGVVVGNLRESKRKKERTEKKKKKKKKGEG